MHTFIPGSVVDVDVSPAASLKCDYDFPAYVYRTRAHTQTWIYIHRLLFFYSVLSDLAFVEEKEAIRAVVRRLIRTSVLAEPR